MKRSKVIALFRFLSGVKVSKVTNKEARAAIIGNHLQMYKIAQENDEDIRELQQKLFEGKEEKINALAALRERFKTEESNSEKESIVKTITSDFADILDLEKEFQATLEEKMNEEISLNLKQISQEAFVDACAEAEVDITPADLVEIGELFNNQNN